MKNDILQKVKTTIKKNDLLSNGDSVLVALSGGADSVFLLNIMLLLKEEFNLTVYAAHINHMLRGKDADSDEEFCRALCKKNGVKLFTHRADVSFIAKENSVSEEVAGRNVRYAFFNEILEKENIKKIATAHNFDDNIETVFMRFIRGTGISGLCGIPYKNNNIIRPILDIKRSEIEEFLSENSISFVTDKTNFEQIYTRNKIRLGVIPEIEKNINQGFKNSLGANISLYSECDSFILEETEKVYNECVKEHSFYTEIDSDKLSKKHDFLIKSVLKKAIERFDGGISYNSVCDLYNVLTGEEKAVNISGGVTGTILYGKLYLHKEIPENFSYSLSVGSNVISETKDTILIESVSEIQKKSGKNVFFANGDKLKKLTARSKKDGDFFYPEGMDNKKVKLKDYFINNKIPSFLRNTIPVITSDDDIIWIAGERYDTRFKANDKDKNIIKFTILREDY